LTRLMSLTVLLLTAAAPARAQLPVPDVTAARDVPDAHELPDPSMEYKVLLMDGASPTPTEAHPTLTAAARYLNTVAAYGGPAGKRQLVVMSHGGIDNILKTDAYEAKHNGENNPNAAIIQALARAGVPIRVCGQAVVGMKIDRAT